MENTKKIHYIYIIIHDILPEHVWKIFRQSVYLILASSWSMNLLVYYAVGKLRENLFQLFQNGMHILHKAFFKYALVHEPQQGRSHTYE